MHLLNKSGYPELELPGSKAVQHESEVLEDKDAHCESALLGETDIHSESKLLHEDLYCESLLGEIKDAHH